MKSHLSDTPSDYAAIPKNSTAVKLITTAIEGNPRLDMDTFEVYSGLIPIVNKPVHTFASIGLKDVIDPPNRRDRIRIRIWFNATRECDLNGFIQGVDLSTRVLDDGVHLYENYGELKKAIQNTIDDFFSKNN